MKTIKFIQTIILSFYFSIAFGQNEEKIKSGICKEFHLINNDKTLKKIVLNNGGVEKMTNGGGQLTGFYKADQLKKIVSWIGLSYGNETFEFYFKNNKLIFVFEQFDSFVYDQNKQRLRLDSTERTFEGRYYFDDDRLINYITTGHNRFENDKIDPQKTLLAEAEQKRKLLTRKLNSTYKQ